MEVLTGPIVRCVDAAGEVGLTDGYIYSLVESGADMVVVVADNGEKHEYMATRFEM